MMRKRFSSAIIAVDGITGESAGAILQEGATAGSMAFGRQLTANPDASAPPPERAVKPYDRPSFPGGKDVG